MDRNKTYDSRILNQGNAFSLASAIYIKRISIFNNRKLIPSSYSDKKWKRKYSMCKLMNKEGLLIQKTKDYE